MRVAALLGLARCTSAVIQVQVVAALPWAQGAGDRAVAAAWVAQTAAAALATAAAGSAGSAPMTKGRGSRRLTSQPTMASLIPYRGSTSVAPTFEA
jgi:hypothetical protein